MYPVPYILLPESFYELLVYKLIFVLPLHYLYVFTLSTEMAPRGSIMVNLIDNPCFKL